MNTKLNAPYVTEKTLTQARRGYYTFTVDGRLSKPAIRQLISGLYHVHITDVRTVTTHGKTRRVGKKLVKTTARSWKKAMVRLSAGETIDAFEAPKENMEEPKKTDVQDKP